MTTVRQELRGLLGDQLRYWSVRLQCWAWRLDPDEDMDAQACAVFARLDEFDAEMRAVQRRVFIDFRRTPRL